MKTVTVTVNTIFQNATPFEGFIRVRLGTPLVGVDNMFVAQLNSQEIDFSGHNPEVSFIAIPNSILGEDTYYAVEIYRDTLVGTRHEYDIIYTSNIVIPDHDCNLADITIVEPIAPEPLEVSKKYASEAKFAAVQASEAGAAAQDAASTTLAYAQAAAQDAAEAESAKTDAVASALASSTDAARAEASASSAASSAAIATSKADETAQTAATALADIESAKVSATSAISDAQTAATSAVVTAQQSAISAIEAKGAEQKALLDTQVGVAEGYAEASASSATAASASASEAAAAAASISGLVPQINANTAGVAQNTASALANKKRIENINALLAGEVYTEAKDSSVAYAKLVGDETVTGGAEVMPYAGVETLGGKTVAWNQAVVDKFTGWSNNFREGVSGTKIINADGSITLTPLVQQNSFGVYKSFSVVPSHKYLQSFRIKVSAMPTALRTEFCPPVGSSIASLSSQVTKVNTWCKISRIAECREDLTRTGFSILNSVEAGSTMDLADPQIFDLTLMFGAGNEPSTVEEFEAMFPAYYYDYDPGTLKSAAVTEVKSVGKNLVNIADKSGTIYANCLSDEEFSSLRTTLNSVVGQNVVLSCDITGTHGPNVNIGTIIIFDPEFGTNAGILTLTPFGSPRAAVSIPEDCFANIYGTTVSEYTISNVQLELGSVATEYTPYTENSLPIPAAVQALEGYGWSAGTAKNWVDWENKVYHREVVQKVCTSGADVRGMQVEASGFSRWVIMLPGFRCVKPMGQIETDLLCSHFASVSRDNTYGGVVGISGYAPDYNSCYICNGMTTLKEVRAWVESQYAAGTPLTINYKLATPELIDISDLLTDDNLISVQEGGVLTFKNALGNDFLIPVPSDVAYTLKLSTEEEKPA